MITRLTTEEAIDRLKDGNSVKAYWLDNEIYFFSHIKIQDFRNEFITKEWSKYPSDIKAYVLSVSSKKGQYVLKDGYNYVLSKVPGDSSDCYISDLPKEFLTRLMLLGFTYD